MERKNKCNFLILPTQTLFILLLKLFFGPLLSFFSSHMPSPKNNHCLQKTTIKTRKLHTWNNTLITEISIQMLLQKYHEH